MIRELARPLRVLVLPPRRTQELERKKHCEFQLVVARVRPTFFERLEQRRRVRLDLAECPLDVVDLRTVSWACASIEVSAGRHVLDGHLKMLALADLHDADSSVQRPVFEVHPRDDVGILDVRVLQPTGCVS